jgi:hypothetical protein
MHYLRYRASMVEPNQKSFRKALAARPFFNR